MATFFGEISPLSSRAVDDEEIEDQPLYCLSLDFKNELPVETDRNCKLLVVSVDEISNAFVKCYLVPDNTQNLFEINYAINKDYDNGFLMYTGGMEQKPKNAATVYSIDQNVIVCDVSSRVPVELYTELFDTILAKVNCEEALVLTSLPTSTFKSEGSQLFEKPFLKSLATSQYQSVRSCSLLRLQAPNFLSNFAAAVLTDFEIKKKPALCIVNYIDSCLFDFAAVQNFETVLHENLAVKLTARSDATSKLSNYLKQKVAVETNLYT